MKNTRTTAGCCGEKKLIPFLETPSGVDCSYSLLTTLEGAPEIVNGDFKCTGNNLGSLKHGPTIVGGNYYCDYSGLTTLEGAPRIIKGTFTCEGNLLQNLIGGPIIVEGSFYCCINNLTSLEGIPKEVGEFIMCGYNPVKFTEADIRKVCNVKMDVM